MEAQIKEEIEDPSLCFETSGDNLGSLTLIERYDKYLQNEISDSGADSDGDILPNETLLKDEFAQMRRSSLHNFKQNDPNTSNISLDTGTNKYKSLEPDCSIVVDVDIDEGNDDEIENKFPTQSDISSRLSKDLKAELKTLDDLVEKLNTVKKFEPNWRNITCTETDIENISEKYGQILDFIYKKAITSFEKSANSKDLELREQEVNVNDDIDEIKVNDSNNSSSNQRTEDLELLAEKIESVHKVRDNYFNVEHEVREQIEQLELVERYKMESVG